MKYLMALDQGTTSSRALIFDEAGHTVAAAQEELPQYYPQPGWSEQEPEEIWLTQRRTAEAALLRSGLKAHEISAIGITNQRETSLLWDRRTGEPVGRAIVWQDRRTAPLCRQLRAEGCEPLFRRRTGLLPDPYFSGTKIRWMLDHQPGLRPRAEAGELAFGTVDTWVIWKLTGGALHATEVTNAARTLLFNIHTGRWDRDLLECLRVPEALLPEVRSCSGSFGEVRLADSPLAGIPLAGVAGDQHAALFGQGCFEAGMAKNTYGTGCFLLMQTGLEPVASTHQLLTTPAWSLAGTVEYALEGSVFAGGATVQWLRDELRLIRTAAEIEPLAASVPDSDGVVLVPAFNGLGAPHWDPQARGMICGLTRGSTAAHIARAALESICFQSLDVLRAMEGDAGLRLTGLRVDGGACVNNLLMQLQADLLQTPVIRPRITETTAFGAAMLAGLAAGVWPDRETAGRIWEADRVFEPSVSQAEVDSRVEQWHKAVERAKAWAV